MKPGSIRKSLMETGQMVRLGNHDVKSAIYESEHYKKNHTQRALINQDTLQNTHYANQY